jgi:hypothetical protein
VAAICEHCAEEEEEEEEEDRHATVATPPAVGTA